jgi:hypothetical protein
LRILLEANGDAVAEVAKYHGVYEQSVDAWGKRFTGMAVDEVKLTCSPKIVQRKKTVCFTGR